MNVRVYVLAFAMLNCLAAAGYAQAKKEADAKPQPPPSALRGNVVPHCEPGNYPAGNICKIHEYNGRCTTDLLSSGREAV